MNRLYLFALIVLYLPFSNLIAQESSEEVVFPGKSDIEISVMVAVNQSRFSIDNDTDGQDFLSTPFFGANIDIFWSDRWSFKTGAYYDAKGNTRGSTDTRLDYITIPTDVNWHFGKKRRWNLNFGNYFGFLLSADQNGLDLKPLFKSVDAGLDFGIGVKIPLGDQIKLHLALNSQTSYGDIGEANNGQTLRNNRGNFSVGLVF